MAEPMCWAVALEGRYDREGVLMLLADRAEAESIAAEIVARGSRVVVVPYTAPAAGAHARLRSRMAS